jgi:Ca2+-binding EF-hand superfamily protein
MEPKELKEDWRKVVREQFVAVDREGLGVVTLEQFTQILKNMGLKLMPEEMQEVLERVDAKKTGLVDFKEYSQIAEEIIKSLIVRTEANEKMK